MSVPHLACHHSGEEFDWWRCNEDGYVGRPPSPFPAAFETPRTRRDDSADLRYGLRGTGGAGADSAADADPVDLSNVEYDPSDESRKLYWPLCQGPEMVLLQDDGLGDADLNSNLGTSTRKTPKLPHKRPPWCPAKMPNKWGVAGHPPPYTNYCKETMFNTRTANPSKLTIKTTF